MQRRDLILDLIEQLGRAWAMLVETLRTQAPQAALTEIDRVSLALLSLRFESARGLSPAALVGRLSFGEPEKLAAARCGLFVALLRGAATAYAQQGNAVERDRCLQQALELRETIELIYDPSLLPDYTPDASELRADLAR